jgi:uncharacterized LabA/DUF88 family protein
MSQTYMLRGPVSDPICNLQSPVWGSAHLGVTHMAPLRTVVFVDGQNFRKNLQAFSFQAPGFTKPYRLDEKHFKWREFFADMVAWFAQETGTEHRLLRAYWYNAEGMTPFQPSPHVLNGAHAECRKSVPAITPNRVSDLAKEWHAKQHAWFYGSRRQMFEEIQRKTDFLEFKFVGQFRVEPFTVRKCVQKPDNTYDYQGTQVGEKGVDIGIAVDMIAKMANYDVAIIVSGDADFVPAVCYLKDHLRGVYQFSVAKGVPPSINYLSPWLKGIVDVFGYFDELALLNTYLDPSSGIPPAVITEIAARIAQLQALLPPVGP